MSVDSGSFIEPSFILSGIHPNYEHVFPVEANVIRDVVANSHITALVVAEEEPVHPDVRVAKDSIEVDGVTKSGIRTWNDESLPVPADACFGKQSTYGLVAMRHHVEIIRINERQFHGPVMRQVEFPPCRIIEAGIDGCACRTSRLGEDCCNAVIEILLRIRSMTKMKTPSFIQAQAQSWRFLGNDCGRE